MTDDLKTSFENNQKTKVKMYFEFVEDLKREELIETTLPEKIIREYFDEMCSDMVKISLEEVLEEKSNYLTLTQGNILSGLLNEDKKKLLNKIRILDGANISIFIVHFFANFNEKRLQTAKLLCAVAAQDNIYKEIFEQHFYETIDQLLFSFNEESISKIVFEDFIIFDRFLTKFLGTLPERTNLSEKWCGRSSKYYMRHSLNLFLDTLKSVNGQTSAASYVEHKLQHPVPDRSQDLPAELVKSFTELTIGLNQMLVKNTMSEIFHQFVQRFHKVACFLLHLQFSCAEDPDLLDTRSEKKKQSLRKVVAMVEAILNSMLFAYLRIAFDLNSQQFQVTAITETLSDAQKRNIWDRAGLYSVYRNRTKFKSIVAINDWFDKTLANNDFESETLNYLKQVKKVKVNKTVDKLENNFNQFEHMVMAFLDMQRVKDLLKLVRPLNILNEIAQKTVEDAVIGIQSILTRSLVNDKLPLESFVMCLVNRKFEDGKAKEYIKLLVKYSQDLENRMQYVLKGCVEKKDSQEFISLSKVGLLNFVLEVYQDMLTKTTFSVENFERSHEDYQAIKKELLCSPAMTNHPDIGISKLLEIKDSLGDKTRSIKLLCENADHFSTLFARKLFDKYFTASDESTLKDILLDLLRAKNPEQLINTSN